MLGLRFVISLDFSSFNSIPGLRWKKTEDDLMWVDVDVEWISVLCSVLVLR
jgi:hypothetical protein